MIFDEKGKSMKHKLTMAEIAKFQQEYEKQPRNRVAELAVVNNGVQKASLNGWKKVPIGARKKLRKMLGCPLNN